MGRCTVYSIMKNILKLDSTKTLYWLTETIFFSLSNEHGLKQLQSHIKWKKSL